MIQSIQLCALTISSLFELPFRKIKEGKEDFITSHEPHYRASVVKVGSVVFLPRDFMTSRRAIIYMHFAFLVEVL